MWEKVKLKKLVSEGGIFIDGDWIESKDQDQNGEIRLIQLADIGVGKFIDKSSRFMTKENASKLKCTFLKKGDILIARMPDPIGRCCVFPLDKDEKYVTVVDVAILRPNNENVSTRFLQHYINSDDFQSKITPNVTGTTRQRISRGKLENLEIPLPPLPIQEKIAEILDKADELRRKDKDLQNKYDELAQTIFIDMFGDPVKNEKGWEVKKVIEECECIVPGRDKPKSFSGDIQWVTTDDLNHLNYTSYSKKNIGLSVSEIKEVKAKKIPKNSVIITCVGNLGICSVNIQEIVINQQLHAFLPRENVNSVFLMFNLSHQKGYMNKMASSTTVPYMNKTVCNNIPIILPPIHLQEAFAKKIELINQLKAQTNAEKSEELFQSLLQKAFKGELVS